MRTYDQLTPDEQAKAHVKAIAGILDAIENGLIDFSENPELQKRIDDSFAEAQHQQTPWFASSIIMENCEGELKAMGLADAQQAFYPEPGEIVIYV